MKIFCLIIGIIAFNAPFSAFGMENDEEVGRRVIKKIQMAASTGTIVGGWGFFAVNSKTLINRLPYGVKRTPLAIFLVSCSTQQVIGMTGVISNPNAMRKIGKISRGNYTHNIKE